MERMVENLVLALKEAIAHKKGELKLKQKIFNTESVHDLREKYQLSQDEFARLFGVSIRTLQQWEQGRTHPSGAAQVLLKVIAHNPAIVREAIERI
jgi:putative transcriptional regulator